jgi:Cu+-exporting ATPase
MQSATHRHHHEGREFGFCSAGCRTKFAAAPEQYLTARDPVCGMSVDRATAKWMSKHEGQRYFFCSAGCQTKFEAAPATYLAAAGAGDHHGHAHGTAPATVPEGAKWTCPMHPQIVRDGPGDCPICGMALEPMTPTPIPVRTPSSSISPGASGSAACSASGCW